MALALARAMRCGVNHCIAPDPAASDPGEPVTTLWLIGPLVGIGLISVGADGAGSPHQAAFLGTLPAAFVSKNCSSSVDPFSAVVEDWLPSIVVVTTSK